MSECILKFDHFTFQYNAQSAPTLHDINLEIRKGEKILIAGPSGCGKSTLIHCINGLIPFSYKGEMTGSLTLHGQETKNLSIFDLSAYVGTVLQDSDCQFVGLTVAEDIAFALENDCVQEPELHERVAKVAKTVNIHDFLGHAPTELSGGQKQRVSMAGVMVDDVELLLFDEPLAALDPATGKRAMELIDEIQKQTGAAVVIVEHRVEDVLHIDMDRIVVMSEGRIVTDCTADKLLAGDVLKNAGIREPLYITALKYAGVDITEEKHPHSIRTWQKNETDTQLVRNWFSEAPIADKKEKPIPVLEIKNLNFAYEKSDKQVLHQIDAQIYKGEMLAIVGTNGAGKTTFAKMICGFETPQTGEILMNGEDFTGYSIKERAEKVGYVMQNPNQMISKVMIMDEVALGLRNRGVSEDVIQQKVEEVLKVCGLWRFRKWPISALSYGQKKRVTIAAILALDPEVIILDEPTAGQDYRHYTEIMEFLNHLNQKGVTIVMITHDMHLMLEYATRALVFSEGRLLADDGCENILTNREIIEKASLKETSLYELAMQYGIEDPTEFVRRFIRYERMHMRGGQEND